MRIFLWQDIKWLYKTLHEHYARIFLLPKVSLETSTPNAYESFVVDKDVLIPMRDGIRLCADIYMPDKNNKYPAERNIL